MIRKLRTNILFLRKTNSYMKRRFFKASNLNKNFLINLLSLGKKRFGRRGFRRKLVWRFFFRKQVTKHYFKFRKYRFRFFKSKRFSFVLKSIYLSKISNSFTSRNFFKYNLFSFLPRRSVLTLLNSQSNFLTLKAGEESKMLEEPSSFLLLLKKKTPLKKAILTYFTFYRLFSVLYKLSDFKFASSLFLTNLKYDFFMYKLTSTLLLSINYVK